MHTKAKNKARKLGLQVQPTDAFAGNNAMSQAADRLSPLARGTGAAATPLHSPSVPQTLHSPSTASDATNHKPKQKLSISRSGSMSSSPRSAKSKSPRPLALRRRPDLLTAHHAPPTVVQGTEANSAVQSVSGAVPASPDSKYNTRPQRLDSSSPRAARAGQLSHMGSSRDATSSSAASAGRSRTNSQVRIDTLGSEHPLGQAADAAHDALVAEGAMEAPPMSPSRRAEQRKQQQKASFN